MGVGRFASTTCLPECGVTLATFEVVVPALIEVKVRAIVERIAPNVQGGFRAESDLYREVGVKSLAALDLLLSLEEEFRLSIADEAFGEARTVAKLVALVGMLLAEKSAA
jgi:acyl carrier protein